MFVPRFDSLLSFDSLTVIRLKGTKSIGYARLSPSTAELHDLMVVYLTDARLVIVTRREWIFELGV